MRAVWMCTVSVIAVAGGYRLVHSRDESRARVPGLDPQVRDLGGVLGIWPIDPAGGGSWVGVLDTGVAVAVMNHNPVPPWPVEGEAVSRGRVVVDLLGRAARGEAVGEGAIPHPEAMRMRPCRVVIVRPSAGGKGGLPGFEVVVYRRTREGFERRLCGSLPVIEATSGIGDALVRGRAARWPGGPMAGPSEQDAFHRDRGACGDGLDVSAVWMSRADARTVSVTAVEVGVERVGVVHRALADAADAAAEPCGPVELWLPRAGG